jgi:integrase
MIHFAGAAPVPERPWEETVGRRPFTVWVGEREVGGNVYVRWTVGRKPIPRSLGFKIRDERKRERKTDKEKALRIAKQILEALEEGQDALALFQEIVTGRPAGGAPAGGAEESSYLTLQKALDRALKVPTGMYVVDDAHVRSMRRVSKLLVEALGPRFSIGDLTAATAEAVWRHILGQARAAGGEVAGYGKAEKAVALLYTVARWIHERNPKEAPGTNPKRGWESKLRAEWEKAFGVKLPDAKKLRYTREEARALFRNLHKADPRVQLAIQLGAELRAGQVSRSMRSHLDLGEVGAFGLGTFEVEGRGKKHGEIVHLTPAQRAFVDQCLGPEGHLHELEEAYQEGRIPDYCLWQKGRIHKGRIPLQRHLASPGPMDPGSLINLFREFEKAAGVTHVHGRDFHGLRRVMTDIAEDYTGDSRELDRLTGHAVSSTRSTIYQDRHKEEFREGAASVRARMRADVEAGRKAPKRTGAPEPQARAARRRLRAALEMEGLAPERIQELLEVLGRAEDGS